MTPLRVIVNGAFGKMGALACQTLSVQPEFQLVACLSRHDDLATAITANQAEMVVDLTHAGVVYANCMTILEHAAVPVIGTSGLLPEQVADLQDRARGLGRGGLIVPNFSIGAVLMMKFSAMAARYFPDVEIIEAHHPKKRDAPSGTAIKTADLIASARKSGVPHAVVDELVSGARGALCQGIAIHSLRLLGVLAQQEVVFGQAGETLTLSHRALDREAFMPGLLLACQRVMSLTTLCYGLEHVLDEHE